MSVSSKKTYMVRGYRGGQQIAQLLLTWLGHLFPEVRYFSICLVGEFGHIFDEMNESLVNIHRQTFLDFAQELSEAAQGQVQFSRPMDDKCDLFSRLVQEYSLNPDYNKVLLGALSEDTRAVLGAGDQTTSKKTALLETLEPLTGTDFDNYQRITNRVIFRDRLYAAGM